MAEYDRQIAIWYSYVVGLAVLSSVLLAFAIFKIQASIGKRSRLNRKNMGTYITIVILCSIFQIFDVFSIFGYDPKEKNYYQKMKTYTELGFYVFQAITQMLTVHLFKLLNIPKKDVKVVDSLSE